MKVMTTIRMNPEIKDFLKKAAKKDYRNLNDFMVNAALVYVKEKLGLEPPDEDNE
jgi:uncharacterized protein (DUF1778 family)